MIANETYSNEKCLMEKIANLDLVDANQAALHNLGVTKEAGLGLAV